MKEVAEATKVVRTTASRRLRRAEAYGLVVREKQKRGPDLWWRLRFDPDQVADLHEVVDSAPAKAARHRRQRLAFLESVARSDTRRVTLETIDGVELFVDGLTGEVLGQSPLP